MTKKMALILSVVLSVICFHAQADEFVAYGRNHSHIRGNSRGHQDFKNKPYDPKRDQDSYSESSQGSVQANSGDAKMIEAVKNKRRLNFVEASGMVVTQLLKDDTSGLQHQKWVVRLSNGSTMQAVYNLDMCDRVPLKVGDVVAMGGQFIWTKQGALLHWLHYDPRKARPDGFVELNGKVYCGDGARH